MLTAGVEVIVGTDEIVPVEHQPGGAIRLLQRSAILFLNAESDYVRIHADSGRYLVRGALSDYQQRWEPYGFVRTHRSFLVNMTRAVEIRPDQHGGGVIALADGSLVPIARRHVADLRRRLALAPAPSGRGQSGSADGVDETNLGDVLQSPSI